MFPSVTVNFNLAPNVSLGQATREINDIQQKLSVPSSLHGVYAGTLQAYKQSLGTEPYLILTAVLAVYIVLGILYEGLAHPITILSTLPPASLGAMLALRITNTELDVMSIIGIILLIGIVKKNAIMTIDFALNAERVEGKNTLDSIFEASMLRFRSILMTTMTATWCSAAGGRYRHGIGVAPSAGHFDYRRISDAPGVDSIHNACDLPVYG